MASSIANKAARRLVMSHAKQYEVEDPFYETWTDSNGKQKRRKRPPPPGLTKAEAQLLRKISRRAHYLDKGFSVCGFRFGWTAIIGIIPGAGDVADACLNYFLVLRPSTKGANLPPWVVTRMWTNNAVSAGVGLVPIAGDMIMAIYKANSRNAKLLEEYLRVLGEEHMAAGLPNLTPVPQPLPGQRQDAHPAQAAARDLAGNTTSGSASGPATSTREGAVATAEATGASTPVSTTSRSKFWQRKT